MGIFNEEYIEIVILQVTESYVFGGKKGQIERLKLESVEVDERGRVKGVLNVKFQMTNVKSNPKPKCQMRKVKSWKV